VFQLNREMAGLERLLAGLNVLLKGYHLEEVYYLSSALELTTQAFHSFVLSELEEAENALMCCYTHTTVQHHTTNTFSTVQYMGSLLIVLVMLLFLYTLFRKLKPHAK